MGGIVSGLPLVGRLAEKALGALKPKLPKLPAPPVSPDNDQAALAAADERRRQRESRRQGRASTVLAGEIDDEESAKAKRTLLGS